MSDVEKKSTALIEVAGHNLSSGEIQGRLGTRLAYRTKRLLFAKCSFLNYKKVDDFEHEVPAGLGLQKWFLYGNLS